MRHLAHVDFRLQGIPCLIGVLYYESYAPAYTSGAPERCYPADGGIGEYEILDRRGRPALWLAKKITPDIEAEIQEAIYTAMEE